MNNLEKAWVMATCALESIKRVRSSDSGYLNVITNEDKSITVAVLSNDKEVLGIGFGFQDLLISPTYTFNNAITKIAEMLKLETHKV